MRGAACRGMDAELFFPHLGENTAPAKAVCAGCPVACDCLAYALENRDTYGIWGGKSERERRVLRRQMPPRKRNIPTRTRRNRRTRRRT